MGPVGGALGQVKDAVGQVKDALGQVKDALGPGPCMSARMPSSCTGMFPFGRTGNARVRVRDRDRVRVRVRDAVDDSGHVIQMPS